MSCLEEGGAAEEGGGLAKVEIGRYNRVERPLWHAGEALQPGQAPSIINQAVPDTGGLFRRSTSIPATYIEMFLGLAENSVLLYMY